MGLRAPPGGTIYEDENWIADHGMPSLVRGYVVLKPKRHVEEITGLLTPESATFGPAYQQLVGAMNLALAPERIYTCSFAEAVRHIHFHLVPRYADMPGIGPELLPAVFAGQWMCTEAEATEAADQLRSALSR